MSGRRGNEVKYNYDFPKKGSFGVFKSNGSVPIEFLMASFSSEHLSKLSYARDVNTSLNFDYMIQRDIDEERARQDISRYLSCGVGEIQKDVVFLPPLLAAVVSVKGDSQLCEHYPRPSIQVETDSIGKVFIREWPGVFKVSNYQQEGGWSFSFDGRHNDKIDLGEAKLEINTASGDIKAKLVVIDGQHRLFALNYLKENDPNLIKDLVVPVCIVFCPDAHENSEIKVPDILRSLFVDVNSTVERVSGHFLTLLSEQTLGSIITREFCKSVLDDYGLLGLGLVEWNTKNHKESLVISREHTITSIGVINSALEECFKTRIGSRALSEIIGVKSCGYKFDFGLDEYGDAKSIPDYFPWRDFNSGHRSELRELVNATVVPALKEMLFETSFFKKYFKSLDDYFVKKEDELKSTREASLKSLEEVKQHLFLNDPLSKSGLKLLGDIKVELQEITSDCIPEFSRKVIFQKAMIDAWQQLASVFVARDLPIERASTYIKLFVERTFSPELSLLNINRTYLQDTIFNGPRVKVTKTAKKQISRLILSNGKFADSLIKDANEAEILILSSISSSEVGSFINQMKNDKIKSFEKSYSTNYSIASVDRERLAAAQERRSEEIKQNKLEKPEFDRLVLELISDEIKDSYDELVSVLKYQDFDFTLFDDDQDEDI